MKKELLLFLIIFFIIAFLGYVVIERFKITPLRRFQLIISYLGGISALLLAGEIYLEMSSREQIERNRLAYNTLENVQRNFLEPQKELVKHFPEGFFMYASLNPDVDFTAVQPVTFDPAKRKQLELYMAVKIFQTVEDFITTAAYNSVADYIWYNGFLMWFQSPVLQGYWDVCKINFSPKAQKLTTVIIDKANFLREMRTKKGKLSAQDYDTVSQKISKDVSRHIL